MKIYFIVLVVWISSSALSQKYTEHDRISLLQKKGLEISISEVQKMNDYDFNLLLNYNFDSYRNEKSDRQIQLVRGPIATIKSLEHCSLNHISFNEKVLKSKKNENNTQTNHSIRTLINIGLGYKQNEINPESY
jgi:hypothetical protein